MTSSTSAIPLCSWITCVLFFIYGGLSVNYDVSSGRENWSAVSTSRCQLRSTNYGVNASCKRRSLHSVPQDLPHNTISLDLSFNLIEALYNESFVYLPKIIVLDLRDNDITLIEAGTFEPLVNLKELVLREIYLMSLPAGLFHFNKHLSVLDLGYNKFSSVPTDALPWSNNMKIFDLSNNRIYSIKSLDFAPLRNCSLITLDLAYNSFRNLPEYTFEALKSIQNLFLHGNRMNNFHLSSFLGNNEINILNIRSCCIKSIIPLNQSCHHPHGSPITYHITFLFNKLVSFPNFVFWGFNSTKFLLLSHNKITTLSNRTFCGLDSLRVLDLSYNHLKMLPQGMFFCNKMLRKLKLDQNKIVNWSGNTVSNLCSLNHLNLSHNSIEYIDSTSIILPSLEYLDLSYIEFHVTQEFSLPGCPNLKILNMSHSGITMFFSYAFTNLKGLRELYITNNIFRTLDFPFQSMKALHILDLSSANFFRYGWYFEQFTNTTSLVNLILHGSGLDPWYLFDSQKSESYFAGLEALITLDLRDNYLNELKPGTFKPLNRLEILLLSRSSIEVLISGVFDGLTSLKTLDLSDNYILEISENKFPIQSQLVFLNISNNKFDSIPTTLFNRNPYLQGLYIQNNRIATIELGAVFPTNFTIDASGNPFICICNLSWFVKWLRSSNVELIHPNETLCLYSFIKDKINSPILSFDPDQYCGINILLISSVSFAAILVVALSLLAYWKRWWLNYKVFLLRLAICGYKEMIQDFDDQNYEYQLNLMYQEEDQGWVDDVMKPILQEKFPQLERVVFGDNDLHIGMFYINALHYAVENSFKTVLLLSNNSVHEAWFISKVRIALEEINDSRLDKVILFFLEDIDDDDLPYLVRLFLSKNKPYMLWTDDEDGQEFFWAQFEKSMRANRELNSVIPV